MTSNTKRAVWTLLFVTVLSIIIVFLRTIGVSFWIINQVSTTPLLFTANISLLLIVTLILWNVVKSRELNSTNGNKWFFAVVLIVIALASTLIIPVSLAVGLKGLVVRAPEIILPLVIIAGVVGLVAVLAAVAGAFSALDLSDKTKALSLPEGSVRAVLALSLVLLFAITAIFLFERTRIGDEKEYSRITESMLDQIPREEITSIQTVTANCPKGEDTCYNVTRKVPIYTEDAIKLAQQILTTVATLVVAVAGFYFGTKSVAAAQGIGIQEPSVRILTPVGPTSRTQQSAPLNIRIETSPKGLAVGGAVHGDDPSSLTQKNPTEFDYTSQLIPGQKATLVFALEAHPEKSAMLVVETQ